jgi:hypothetical protein
MEHKAFMVVNLGSPASWLPPKHYQMVDQARTLGVYRYLLQYTTTYDCLSKTGDGEIE